MRKITQPLIAVCALFALSANVANATPIEIVVQPTSEGSSVESNITNSACYVPCYVETSLSEDLDEISTTLGVGESWTFDFFEITVGGLGFATATVEATLAFLQPDVFAASSGDASFFTFLGWFSAGTLIWDQPGAIELADGTFLGIGFENLIEAGFGNTTTVSATVHRYQAIPEPGTLALFGFGLLLLGVFHLRRKPTAGRV